MQVTPPSCLLDYILSITTSSATLLSLLIALAGLTTYGINVVDVNPFLCFSSFSFENNSCMPLLPQFKAP